MRFSTRTRYGLRFLLRLAAQPQGSLLQLGQVAKEENISSGYLEQIVRALRPMGILRAVRGSGGGYALAKPPQDINMEEVFQHLEGEISPVRCLTKGRHCLRETRCSTRGFWSELDEHIRGFLRQRSLQNIIDSEKPVASGGNYVELH
ncbi:Rrf2 family transcriptional regulator [Desulfovibrio legallii]|jgi:Rrf2 family protein|uniref:Rrf2 family transcriptional regulator n=1 Tax=Desulfovibrio legallii TaxID=571438 RepID=A0A6H3FER4_9BACT|nr:Rrf2 family transcriptional regulator [Desulfovibrio legallii]RHH26175.1 Rrf2 family transcriptional regulator [Desulfovibrio sp. AM18-2]TBH81889.1 Rrf2 family transcriptional regulator [Desulfovibrio legallii]CAI3224662.1 Iron-sulfur cluster regulator IscR [Desulfovibrio diazotrophicus]VVU42673.1 Iron-sulfur cluster regulator IscR [Desulfovibrio diazotrophicus]